MVEIAESSSTPPNNDKPVIVRVKRKAFQSPLEAFWLEINERPLKRPLLDFEKLSLSNSSAKAEQLKTKKVFVQHVETVSSPEVAFDILQSFVPSSTVNTVEFKARSVEQRRTFKAVNKQDQLLVKAKEKQEVLAKNARFEQIWRSRKKKNDAMHDESLHDMCHLYDVVRVDVEETTEGQEQEDVDLEDQRIMSSFLPLLREFIPSAAEEIESDINNYMGNQAFKDDYVYDFYVVKDNGISMMEKDASNPFPLVQVDDDDDNYYDGPNQSEFESDDSNAEDNPLNDYPDEETSGGEEEVGSKASDDKSEEDESANTSDKSEDFGSHCGSIEADLLFEDDMYGDDDNDGRWSYR